MKVTQRNGHETPANGNRGNVAWRARSFTNSFYVDGSSGQGRNYLPLGRTLLFCWALMLLIFSAPSAMLRAQSSTGTSVGTVSDSTGGAVAGATVTLTNAATGDMRTTVSNTTGAYQFVNVQPGNYKLDVVAPGFKHYTQTNVTIQVGSSTRADAIVQIGNVSETVEVTSQAALLETQQATVGQVVEGRSVTDMPLNGRSVLSLVALAPGVVPVGFQPPDAVYGMIGTFFSGNYMISGGIPNAGVQFLDGGTLNTGYINALAFAVVPVVRTVFGDF